METSRRPIIEESEGSRSSEREAELQNSQNLKDYPPLRKTTELNRPEDLHEIDKLRETMGLNEPVKLDSYQPLEEVAPINQPQALNEVMPLQQPEPLITDIPRDEQLQRIENVRTELGNKAARMVAREYRVANIKRTVSNLWKRVRGH